jgi:YggT family protein
MLIYLIYVFLRIYSLVVLARVLISWFPDLDRSNPAVQFLYDVTEPLLQPIRQFLRQQFPDMGPFDFSPIVLMVGIMVVQQVLVSIF